MVKKKKWGPKYIHINKNIEQLFSSKFEFIRKKNKQTFICYLKFELELHHSHLSLFMTTKPQHSNAS